jgi:hypothetical protein
MDSLDNSAGSNVTRHMEKVVLTRRRWDAYMMPAFLGAVTIGILRFWQTGQLQDALSPIAVIPIWLMLRLYTPRDGMPVTTIRSTPGAVVLLWSIAAMLISTALLFAFDHFVFGRPFHAPLEPYHAVLYAPPFIIIFAGAFWADRIAKAQRASARRSDTEENGI